VISRGLLEAIRPAMGAYRGARPAVSVVRTRIERPIGSYPERGAGFKGAQARRLGVGFGRSQYGAASQLGYCTDDVAMPRTGRVI
jgi:hypothetical protein